MNKDYRDYPEGSVEAYLWKLCLQMDDQDINRVLCSFISLVTMIYAERANNPTAFVHAHKALMIQAREICGADDQEQEWIQDYLSRSPEEIEADLI